MPGALFSTSKSLSSKRICRAMSSGCATAARTSGQTMETTSPVRGECVAFTARSLTRTFPDSMSRWNVPRETSGNFSRRNESRRSRGSDRSTTNVSVRPLIALHCRTGQRRRLRVGRFRDQRLLLLLLPLAAPRQNEEQAHADADGAVRHVERRKVVEHTGARDEMKVKKVDHVLM